jgi:manganese/iron transport system ATP-binding protein/manganese/zinc/iron transport system ATP- binding protein
MSAPRASVEVAGLSASYGTGAAAALRDVTFTAIAGQAIAVLGPNGGGKTTLFRALLGELPAATGSVSMRGATAYVPQTERSRLDFPVSALDVALMGAYARTPWYRRIGAGDRALARDALARVGLADRAGARFGALSGGQRQRVLIARALVQEAGVLLLDEPFAGVDRTSEEAIMGILDELRAEGRVLLIATHDVEQARGWDRVLCLAGAQIAFGPPAVTLTNAVLEATYGEEIVMLDCGHRAVAIQHHSHAH